MSTLWIFVILLFSIVFVYMFSFLVESIAIMLIFKTKITISN